MRVTTCGIACFLLSCWTAGFAFGEALGLRHEDMGIAERAVTITPRPNDNRARVKAGISRTIPASPELMRLYADYLTREYGALDSITCYLDIKITRIVPNPALSGTYTRNVLLTGHYLLAKSG